MQLASNRDELLQVQASSQPCPLWESSSDINESEALWFENIGFAGGKHGL